MAVSGADPDDTLAVVKRVLVVDDEAPIRLAVTRALRLAGYEVITAANGLERLPRSRADAVLLDVKLPGLDGFGFLDASGDDPSNARAPVVMMSADDQLQRRAMQVGAQGFLRKPFA